MIYEVNNSSIFITIIFVQICEINIFKTYMDFPSYVFYFFVLEDFIYAIFNRIHMKWILRINREMHNDYKLHYWKINDDLIIPLNIHFHIYNMENYTLLIC